MNNNAFATTGLFTVTVNSIHLFQVQPWRNGLPWDLTMGQATLILADPNGNVTSISGTPAGGGAFASWQVVGPTGVWQRAWDMTDASGKRLVSKPVAFGVVSSPV